MDTPEFLQVFKIAVLNEQKRQDSKSHDSESNHNPSPEVIGTVVDNGVKSRIAALINPCLSTDVHTFLRQAGKFGEKVPHCF